MGDFWDILGKWMKHAKKGGNSVCVYILLFTFTSRFVHGAIENRGVSRWLSFGELRDYTDLKSSSSSSRRGWQVGCACVTTRRPRDKQSSRRDYLYIPPPGTNKPCLPACALFSTPGVPSRPVLSLPIALCVVS